MIKIKTKSPEETMKIASDLASGKIDGICKGNVVLLVGEVGSGKTTFVKGFASYWGLGASVTSPTFTIINEYKNELVIIYHIDLYRLYSVSELEELGLEDFITHGDYSFIEWPDKAKPLLNFKTANIHITIEENEMDRLFIID